MLYFRERTSKTTQDATRKEQKDEKGNSLFKTACYIFFIKTSVSNTILLLIFHKGQQRTTGEFHVLSYISCQLCMTTEQVLCLSHNNTALYNE